MITKEINAGTYTVVRTMTVQNTSADHFSDRYSVGDQVLQLYGSKHIVVLPKRNDTHCQCAVCGRENAIENALCEECGHTLIKKYREKAPTVLFLLQLSPNYVIIKLSRIKTKQNKKKEVLYVGKHRKCRQ
ncbi:MAG: hypothetical protein J6Q82_07650 [Clostridia bacterium]|nr:hypothetical protein [Clostridia bacterium]